MTLQNAAYVRALGQIELIFTFAITYLYFRERATVNEIMAEYFSQPYPARAAIGVASLPRGAGVEMDGVMELD